MVVTADIIVAGTAFSFFMFIFVLRFWAVAESEARFQKNNRRHVYIVASVPKILAPPSFLVGGGSV